MLLSMQQIILCVEGVGLMEQYTKWQEQNSFDKRERNATQDSIFLL